MATFTWLPSPNSRRESRPRILSAMFGDGYEQRVDDGINNLLPVWSLVFDVRSAADTTAIDNFLSANKSTVFDWTPPFGAAGKFICRSWDINALGPDTYEITATFEQVPA